MFDNQLISSTDQLDSKTGQPNQTETIIYQAPKSQGSLTYEAPLTASVMNKLRKLAMSMAAFLMSYRSLRDIIDFTEVTEELKKDIILKHNWLDALCKFIMDSKIYTTDDIYEITSDISKVEEPSVKLGSAKARWDDLQKMRSINAMYLMGAWVEDIEVPSEIFWSGLWWEPLSMWLLQHGYAELAKRVLHDPLYRVVKSEAELIAALFDETMTERRIMA